ncbi:MAG TPA: DUF3179 domain-containing protein [Candidatus Limnocylindrales bacterium]|nr:DUF3179 domain-containing protein [Candidatus Limnocylindrales bacterium]
MGRHSALWVSIMITGVVVAACSVGAQPASPRGADATNAPSPTTAPSSDPSRLRVSTSGWKTDFTKASVDLAEFLGGGPPKDGIPAIDKPEYESIADARGWLSDKSPVVLLAVGDEARAYPLAILMWHEIANDMLGGIPVVVTFCPLCNTALAFERELDDVVHDFGTTGNLRFSDLVMYDRQTESWWQQATGEAIVGELIGTKLTFLPAQIVSLADFERAHPDGDVLSRETGFNRDYGSNPYVGYDTIDQNPFLFDGVLDGRLPPKERVVTVGEGAAAVAFPYSELRKVGVAQARGGGDEIVVFWTPGTASALEGPHIDESKDIGATGAFRPAVDGRRLTFARNGGEDAPIRDRETGSTWSVTGIATDGELTGSRLEPVVHGDHFWFAWAAFSPQTTIWTAG